MSLQSEPQLWVGVSLKMYFSHAQTRAWCEEIAHIATTHPMTGGNQAPVALFVAPSFPSIPMALEIFAPTPVLVGAQNLATQDFGAQTGEVSGAELAELGCSLVEIGHAERLRLFGESPQMIQLKVASAVRNGLIPLLCVGEQVHGSAQAAAQECIAHIESALSGSALDQVSPTSADKPALLIAYEPQWAIGATEPAPEAHIQKVCKLIHEYFAQQRMPGSARVIYGGSAGPGLLTRLGTSVDGVFLGRFAHEPEAVRQVLDEAATLLAPVHHTR